MATVPIIATMLNVSVSALTPVERWKAAGGRLDGNFMSESRFIVAIVAVIVVLTVLLVVISMRQVKQRQRNSNRLFDEYCQKSGLSEREDQILMYIAGKAGIERSEDIFTMSDAFDRGASIMVEGGLDNELDNEKESGRIEQLKTELVHLREKLGFRRQTPASVGAVTKSRKLSSRQIPVGKKLYITRRKARNLSAIETTVVKNDDFEIAVKLAEHLESSTGELWRAHYYFGASVWEFDTAAVSCDGDILVLNHNDNVRFINRRRFLRVPVNKPAFVAPFPFSKELVINGNHIEGESGSKQSLDAVTKNCWRLPEFVPAVVTELAGPGLCIDVQLNIKVGDRVLVVFELEAGKRQDAASGGSPVPSKTKSRVVEDIGLVRHSKATENGFSIAVELTGLSDSDVNELIHATNAASLETYGSGRKTDGQGAKQDALEGAVA